ncbi:D-alanine--D-alanine ligase [Seinonella peptonophila]|uniref:D-alanine--D-alanine ligase n=1 Tax=Seinonella peptonophila TaxID=112248 RepID=A0A1M5B0B4_9BACL|nr:D-alanine--D-alanine ligase [Seinonella peptonophila]SHF35757.1 D-alanine--D-alanine ligase [Seinonella peptonophila]
MNKKIKVAILYGGKSTEHEVSLHTALSVMQAINIDRYDVHPVYINQSGDWIPCPPLTEPIKDMKTLIDVTDRQTSDIASISPLARIQNLQDPPSDLQVIFPLLHGVNGEDGTVQGLFELLDIPYVGANVLASAIAMDKVILRDLFQTHGFAQPNYLSFTQHKLKENIKTCCKQVEQELGFPCFVKPANAGSSVGISKCLEISLLEAAIHQSLKYDQKVIIEEAVKGKEIEIGVIGNDQPIASVAGEVQFSSDFYDYHSKYHANDTKLMIPANIPSQAYEKIKEMALRAFQAIQCSGLARIDFYYTEENQVLINEINTLPGFTPQSMFPQLWAHSGLPYAKLIDCLIEYAIEKHTNKTKITYHQPTLNKDKN